MSRSYAVVTAVGSDRVGIVQEVSAELERRGCNIEESKMAVLGGEFALIVLVSASGTQLDALSGCAAELEAAWRLRVAIKNTTEPRPTPGGRPYLLQSVSLDAPGIVHSISDVLARHAVNVEELDSETTSAPWTGATMFRLRAHVVLPAGLSATALRAELEELEQERDLDITLKPVAGWEESG